MPECLLALVYFVSPAGNGIPASDSVVTADHEIGTALPLAANKLQPSIPRFQIYSWSADSWYLQT